MQTCSVVLAMLSELAAAARRESAGCLGMARLVAKDRSRYATGIRTSLLVVLYGPGGYHGPLGIDRSRYRNSAHARPEPGLLGRSASAAGDAQEIGRASCRE